MGFAPQFQDGKTALKKKVIQGAILDVWENEPNIDKELFELCYLGTPHIAGYSYDAKIKGSTMIAEKLAAFFKLPLPTFGQIGKSEVASFLLPKQFENDQEQLKIISNLFYDPRTDHNALKEVLINTNSGENFDNLRKKYRKRREFQVVPLEYQNGLFSATFANKLKVLQFKKH